MDKKNTTATPLKTEYGYRRGDGFERYTDAWGLPLTKDEAATIAKDNRGYCLVAREVTSSRVVSIR